MSTSIDRKEIDHFAKDSAHWWDETGPFAPLHRLNPVRMSYIREQIGQHFDRPAESLRPFEGLKMIDVGCGGGLVCEPLARLGASVTGLDADENAIAVAKDHAEKSGLAIDYRSETADRHKGSYDVVLALEIVEHVSDVDSFVQDCVKLCGKNGLVIFSTLNRTLKSMALGIVAAEYVLQWVPRGTHQWKKFVRPSELAHSLRRAGAGPKNQNGLYFNPVKGEFKLSDQDFDVNYFMTAEC